ncbi:Spherulation-specific family 4 [Plectosphaerella cucumerina]|jgi:hypothetical protein|uniref:Spherulation-specific family 4 n=1 Tax=Plectosphaerella cucumerina TaxID=40658 RepID=A0A8K0X4G1_9PEZI|nr:Spherulation-specific family 4 [Plectosphaerella cucumerina]
MAPVILLPLYIYPLEGAWEPLFGAAQANPGVTFQVVVNPGNGPGPDPLPDASYMAALRRLCELPNVEPLGYVHCTYGQRDAAPIQRDIETYMGWNDHGLRVHGIFFDETPWEPVHADLMASYTQHVRETWRRRSSPELEASSASSPSATSSTSSHGGNPPGGASVVVYNPGVVVVEPYFNDADYIVVFEQSAGHWEDYFLNQGLPQIPARLRHKAVAVVHTCDEDRPERSVGGLARQISALGFGGVHLTDELDGGYTKWPAQWGNFAASL